MKKDILFDIVEHKRQILSESKKRVPIDYLKALVNEQPPCVDFKEALEKSPTGIIAEFKRKSPSKDWINRSAEISEIAPAYQAGGASAISVLTDHKYFGGSIEDLKIAATHVEIPLLRKDFIIDEYQLYEARVFGADAVLLIAACLSPDICWSLADKAHELGMEVLLEIHNPEELGYINDSIKVVGVNNRNLGTFHTDVQNSFKMAEALPKDKVLVAESGISDPDIVKALRKVGYRGFLIGEAFMHTTNPGLALTEFIQSVKND